MKKRVVSGIRASGDLHIGHYHGVIKHWIDLQSQYDCYFFIADLHGLTTFYKNSNSIKPFVWNMLVDWFACGINPNMCKIFIQSWISEHIELFLLLSMITPLNWVEHVPFHKNQKQKNFLRKDFMTYGFLGYPILQSSDILLYRADYVPIGHDQIAHIELTRKIVRKFNFLYKDNNLYIKHVIFKVIQDLRSNYNNCYIFLKKILQNHDGYKLINEIKLFLANYKKFPLRVKQDLLSKFDVYRKKILNEPKAIIRHGFSKVVGIDGKKMSKSLHNTISLRENLNDVKKKIFSMPTDPNRIKRYIPGNPRNCSIWQLHNIYSTDSLKEWIRSGCCSAKIGCVDCKKIVVDSIKEELFVIQEKIQFYQSKIDLIKSTVIEHTEIAKKEAKKTLDEIKIIMGLDY
ncbi:tryptophan--tRNA ligase [Candidatus Legionella polyplacis]|uniref:tryptophan--tRNA ligase n=1 Tax=Candidatus Legionella polyplacis TaxID=2005262 RepID=A0ABZ2GZI9_9GAMM|nr:hypothetical protein [Candidatus Legionella polyplacis]ATW01723.1 tryptophan--tRNA ligase [Candidatus Legionella polyplacis]